MLPVIGVLIAFTVIVILRLKNIDFSLSILAGSTIIALTSASPAEVLVEAAIATLCDPDTVNLTVAVILISVFGYSLKETSLIEELIDGLRGVLPVRVLLAVIPAVFGLLTIPGGALMSAPFNELEADRLGLRPEQRTYVNVWFRHLWYWASPLSPVPILTAKLAGFTLTVFLKAQLPILIITLAIGFLVGGTFIRGEERASSGGGKAVVRGLAPIALVLALSTFGVPVALALIPGIVLLFALKGVSPEKALEVVHSGVRWDIAAVVVTMFFFRAVVVSSGSVDALFEIITKLGIPLMAVLVVVPLLVGSISSTPTMGIGIILPLLLPFTGGGGLYVVGIIYAGVIAGYLASPMHLCLALTNRYYGSQLGRVYRYLIPSTIALYVVALTYNIAMNRVVPTLFS